jgi:hypothetical protein
MPIQSYPQLGDRNVWRLIEQRSVKAAVDRGGDITQAIAPFVVQFPPDLGGLIAIGSESRSAKPTWKRAGFAQQLASIGVPGHELAYCDRALALPLFRLRLMSLQPTGAGAIEIRTRPWIVDCQWKIWRYNGTEPNPTQTLGGHLAGLNLSIDYGA